MFLLYVLSIALKRKPVIRRVLVIHKLISKIHYPTFPYSFLPHPIFPTTLGITTLSLIWATSSSIAIIKQSYEESKGDYNHPGGCIYMQCICVVLCT